MLFDRAGLPAFELEPLDRAAAVELLDHRFPALAPRVRDRLIIEAQGNPLALLELPIALGDREPPRHHPTGVLPLTARLQELFASRIRGLPAPTIFLLLVAALDGTGDLRIVEAAAPAGAGLDDLAPAEHAKIVDIDESAARLTFRHPLFRSAIVALSTSDQRRHAHRLLAACMELPERRAWHLSEATVGPDESVASLVELVARTQLDRGNAVRAVAAMSRAAELSPSKADQRRRWALASYIAATVLGDMSNAPRLLDDVHGIEADPDHTGSLAGAVAGAYHLLNGDGDVDTAHRLLVGAIEMVPNGDAAKDDVLVEAIYNLLEVCFFGGRAELWPPFDRAIGRLEPHPPPFLQLLAGTIPDPARHAAGVLDQLDDAIGGLHHESSPTRIVRIAVASSYVDRLPQCRTALWRVVNDGRAGGAITMSIQALALLGFDAFLTGQWDALTDMADEAVALCDEHHYGLLRWPARSLRALVAAVRGDSDSVRAIADEVVGWAVPDRPERCRTTCCTPAPSTPSDVATSRPRTSTPARSALPARSHHTFRTPCGWCSTSSKPRHEPVATTKPRPMSPPRKTPAFRRSRHGSRCSPTAQLRWRRPTTSDAAALFERALTRPAVEQWPFDLARVQLAFGERLRRERAMARSRQLLTAASDTFHQLGAQPWTHRAAAELRATGLATGPTDLTGVRSLTPQQLQIAQLAAEGLTNKDIGTRLFLSHRTVSTHLYQVFPKLGITAAPPSATPSEIRLLLTITATARHARPSTSRHVDDDGRRRHTDI